MLIETAAELREANLDLLDRFDAFCNAHGIRYFMTFGTLLGAVRHQDIIPWDDDIDVTMLRPEYEKLVMASRQGLPEGCELYIPEEEPTFCGFTPMFKDCNLMAKMIKGSDSDDGSGYGRLGIDIFVLDPSYTGFRHRILKCRQLVLYSQARAHRAVKKPLDTRSFRLIAVPVVGFLQSIGRMRGLDGIMKKYRRISLGLKSDGRTLYSPCNNPCELGHEYEAEWFRDSVRLPLGGRTFPAPIGYEEFLERIFGDYVRLPPESARFPEHFVLREFQ